MQVKDLMTKKVISVNAETRISDIANLLMKNRIHGVPVVDSDNRVAGIITETDFFTKDSTSLYLPSFIDFLKRSEFLKIISSSMKSEIDKLLQATANDIMTSDCITISSEADIKDVLKIMKEKSINSIPVVSQNHILVGIITMADIIKLF